MANYWDVVIKNWAIAWIRIDDQNRYRVKLTGKIQGDMDHLEHEKFTSLEDAARMAVGKFTEHFGREQCN